jgi:hypothetical protein
VSKRGIAAKMGMVKEKEPHLVSPVLRLQAGMFDVQRSTVGFGMGNRMGGRVPQHD